MSFYLRNIYATWRFADLRKWFPAILISLISLTFMANFAATVEAPRATERDTGRNWCAIHKFNFFGVGARCPKCLAERSAINSSSSGNPGFSIQDQMVLDAANQLGTALGQMLSGNPEQAAKLQAEARERALARERDEQLAAAEAERKSQETLKRLKGEMKGFDGDDGGLLLKGVDGKGRSFTFEPHYIDAYYSGIKKYLSSP